MIEGDEKDDKESKSWFEIMRNEGPRDKCMCCESPQPRYSIVHSAFLTPQQIAVMGVWLCQKCLEKFHRSDARIEEEMEYERLCLEWASEGYDGCCFGRQEQRKLGLQIIKARQALRKAIWKWIDEQRKIKCQNPN